MILSNFKTRINITLIEDITGANLKFRETGKEEALEHITGQDVEMDHFI